MQLKIRVRTRQYSLGRCIHEFYYISMVIILFNVWGKYLFIKVEKQQHGYKKLNMDTRTLNCIVSTVPTDSNSKESQYSVLNEEHCIDADYSESYWFVIPNDSCSFNKYNLYEVPAIKLTSGKIDQGSHVIHETHPHHHTQHFTHLQPAAAQHHNEQDLIRRLCHEPGLDWYDGPMTA
uniref:Uncharacterized protein n=1 Tax=Vespula pensylvanica TaxID=30213 RepID=A0A834JQI3_VESPE|nr:hypothetical protein H0235_017451 [Vespula pensylvanica]